MILYLLHRNRTILCVGKMVAEDRLQSVSATDDRTARFELRQDAAKGLTPDRVARHPLTGNFSAY